MRLRADDNRAAHVHGRLDAERGWSRPPLGYRPALDGVRAIAVSMVVLHHTGAFLVPAWQGRLLPSGFLGVDIFFVLSGFLITSLLLERRDQEQHAIGTFYVRRILRLVPAVIVLLAANLAYATIERHGWATLCVRFRSY